MIVGLSHLNGVQRFIREAPRLAYYIAVTEVVATVLVSYAFFSVIRLMRQEPLQCFDSVRPVKKISCKTSGTVHELARMALASPVRVKGSQELVALSSELAHAWRHLTWGGDVVKIDWSRVDNATDEELAQAFASLPERALVILEETHWWSNRPQALSTLMERVRCKGLGCVYFGAPFQVKPGDAFNPNSVAPLWNDPNWKELDLSRDNSLVDVCLNSIQQRLCRVYGQWVEGPNELITLPLVRRAWQALKDQTLVADPLHLLYEILSYAAHFHTLQSDQPQAMTLEFIVREMGNYLRIYPEFLAPKPPEPPPSWVVKVKEAEGDDAFGADTKLKSLVDRLRSGDPKALMIDGPKRLSSLWPSLAKQWKAATGYDHVYRLDWRNVSDPKQIEAELSAIPRGSLLLLEGAGWWTFRPNVLVGLMDKFRSKELYCAYFGPPPQKPEFVASLPVEHLWEDPLWTKWKLFDEAETDRVCTSSLVKEVEGGRLTTTVAEAAITLSKRYFSGGRPHDKAVEVVQMAHVRHPDRAVTEEDVRNVIAELTGLPLQQLGTDEKKWLLEMPARLKQRVIGQDVAVEVVSRAVQRSRLGMGRPHRPIGSFMFKGPTGVGKTELAKAVAADLFGSEGKMVRIDMSEYSEKHSVSKLTGPPPGYIGFEGGGQLTNAIEENPFTVVLLDEVEKAHPDVLNLFLQMFDDGRITDSKGKTIDCSNVVFVMTTNVKDVKGVYPGTSETSGQRYFRDELLGRLVICEFNPVEGDVLKTILGKEINEAIERCKAKGVDVTVTGKARQHLLGKNTTQGLGARPLQRLVDDEIITPIGDKLLKGETGTEVTVDVESGELTFRFSEEEA